MAYIPVTNQSVSGTVGASIIGLPAFTIAGSVATVGTTVANQSVSGTVVATQIAGSILATSATFTPPANQSVSGTVNVNGSVVAFQGGTNISSISGNVTVVSSIAGGVFPISGSVAAVVTNNVTVVSSIAGGIFPISGSVAAVITNFPTTQNVSGSVIAQIASSVLTVTSGTVTANQGTGFGSVAAWLQSGNASIITVGTAVTNQSISGAVSVSNLPTTQNVSGSVVAFQGTSPWVVAPNNSSLFSLQVAGSVMAISGSLTAPANQSVSGTVITTQIAGSVMAISGSLTPAANQSVSGTVHIDNLSSVIAYQLAGSVMATSATAAANQSVSGTVGASIIGVVPITGNVGQTGITISSISGTVAITDSVGSTLTSTTNHLDVNIASGNASVSGTVGASIIGLTPVTVSGLQGSSISGTVNIGIIPGSVVAFPSTTWSGSVLAVIKSGVNASVSGTVGTTQVGTWISSISGVAMLEDSAHGTADVGLFVMGVRNDTLASISSSDIDYTRFTVGSAGETPSPNAPYSQWVQGNATIATGPSVQAIAAQGASVFTYVTGIQVTNASANNVYVTFTGGLGSILGYTVAPANGGSNINYPNALKTGANSGFSASISGVASVFLSAQGFISKT